MGIYDRDYQRGNYGPQSGFTLGGPTSLTTKLIIIMFGVSFALTSLGVVIASHMTSFEGFGTISNFVVMPMYFLSGGIYPTSTAPVWMQPFISINPLSYGVDALRHITIGQGTFAFGLDVAFLAGFTVVMSIIALWLFKRE